MLAATGCALVSADASRPSLPPGSPYRMSGDGTIHLPGIKLRLFPATGGSAFVLVGPFPLWLPSPERRAGEFLVAVYMETESADTDFDTRMVTLAFPNGPAVTPAAAIGPRRANWDSGAPTRFYCIPDVRPETQPDEPITVGGIRCIDMRFDVPTPPTDREFSVTMAGIRRAGQPVAPVTVNFAKGRAWELGSFNR